MPQRIIDTPRTNEEKILLRSGRHQRRPFTAREIQQLLYEGTIGTDAWIRSEQSTTWRKLEDVSFDEPEEPAATDPSSRKAAAMAMLGSLTWKTKLLLAILIIVLLPSSSSSASSASSSAHSAKYNLFFAMRAVYP